MDFPKRNLFANLDKADVIRDSVDVFEVLPNYSVKVD